MSLRLSVYLLFFDITGLYCRQCMSITNYSHKSVRNNTIITLFIVISSNMNLQISSLRGYMYYVFYFFREPRQECGRMRRIRWRGSRRSESRSAPHRRDVAPRSLGRNSERDDRDPLRSHQHRAWLPFRLPRQTRQFIRK